MALITVKRGKREGAFAGPDGTYAATLTALEGPREAINSKTGEPFQMMDWTFAIDDAPDEASLVWTSTSTASGPQSKLYGHLTALLGGTSPAPGQNFEAGDLVGRSALVTFHRNPDGWIKVDNVSAIPRQLPATAPRTVAPSPQPTQSSVARSTPATLREQVEQGGRDSLPF